jgi:hypothetical protein
MGTGRRIANHGRDIAENKRLHRYLIIKKIMRRGESVGYSVSFFETRPLAAEDEKRLIALYGRIDAAGGTLTNRTDGGDGGHGFIVDDESRARISATSKRLWADPEFRAKAMVSRQSPDALASLSESVRSLWGDPEYRERATAAMREAAKRPVRIAQIAAARKGKPMSSEYRLKISKANKGRKFTAEHRAKIAESRRRQWADPSFRDAVSEKKLQRAAVAQPEA